jgi:hypothetical protein
MLFSLRSISVYSYAMSDSVTHTHLQFFAEIPLGWGFSLPLGRLSDTGQSLESRGVGERF